MTADRDKRLEALAAEVKEACFGYRQASGASIQIVTAALKEFNDASPPYSQPRRT